MHTHALTAALTLYRSGTLTLDQAARRAGRSPAAMRATLHSYGVVVREPAGTPSADAAAVRAN
jgi:hypothetical protein